MPSAWSAAPSPMPESISSFGVSIAPAEQTTLRLARKVTGWPFCRVLPMELSSTPMLKEERSLSARPMPKFRPKTSPGFTEPTYSLCPSSTRRLMLSRPKLRV